MTSTNLTRRTREVTRTRTEAITRNGRTSYVEIPYTVNVPIPPRDWDHIVLTGVTTAAGLVVAGSLAWSTASIGDLLSRAAHPAVAYTAAAVFDLAWITALAAEWLARYNPRKAKLPRIAGYVALVVAMAAICTHGALQDGHGALAVGIIGALVSALAKGMWTLVLSHHAQPLDVVSQQWVDQQRAEAGAEEALAAFDLKLARVRGKVADYQAAYAIDTGPQPDPDKPSGQPAPVSGEIEAAVRTAIATMPGATAEEISEALAGARFEVSPAAVRAVSGQQDTSSGTVSHIAPHTPGESIADTVRRAVRAGLDNPEHILAAVRRVHGHGVLEATVTRTLTRVRPPRATG
jgi:hypothetical protein